MQIHVARDSSSLGVFSVEDVISGLKNGRFLMTDLAWREGMSNWVMLAQWSEFVGVLPTASTDAAAQSNNLPSTVPWEKSPSLGSYFKTIKGALLTPYVTFASGTFSFKQYIAFGYITALFLIPLSIFGKMYGTDVNQNLIKFLESIDHNAFSQIIQSLKSQPQTNEFRTVCSVLCYTAFYPFLIALIGVFLWLGLKLFRESVTLDQTVVATLISTSAINLCTGLILLTVAYENIYTLLSVLSIIPSTVISCRSTAAVLKVSPFKVFGVWFMLGLVSCCLCACGAVLAALVWG